MYFFNYPAETPEAVKFWGSRHNANIAKAYVAFSLDKEDFIEITKRAGFTRAWRDRMWEAFGQYVNQPDMTGIPFSEMSDLWWNEMPTPPLHQFSFPELVPVPMDEPDPDPVYPRITTLAHDMEVTEGEEVTIVTDGDDYDYIEWYRNGYLIDGENSKSYTFTPTYRDNNAVYVASYVKGPVSSSTRSILTVLSGVPEITSNPQSGNGVEGVPYSLTSSSSNFDSVQWYKLNRSTLRWEEIQGKNTPNITVTEVSTGFHENYRATYTNAFGSSNTEVAEVFFGTQDATPSEYSLELTVEKTASGTQIGYWENANIGDISPGEWGDTPEAYWKRLSITVSNGNLFMVGEGKDGTAIKYDNKDHLFLEFEGYGHNPLRVDWSSGRYSSSAPDLLSYFEVLADSSDPSIGLNVIPS